jgi:hypothetical protein
MPVDLQDATSPQVIEQLASGCQGGFDPIDESAREKNA